MLRNCWKRAGPAAATQDKQVYKTGSAKEAFFEQGARQTRPLEAGTPSARQPLTGVLAMNSQE